jgi:hypothetical protein
MLSSIPSFARLVAELAKFPGVGNKTATRLAFFLLRQSEAQAEALATAILDLQRNTRFCSVCFHITEQDPCLLCNDPRRDESILCVIEEPQALLAIERSRSFRGRYHVLHGALSPYDGLSIGILSSLKGVGYGSGGVAMPIVTGQDAEVPSVKSMLAGEQYSTVFKDTRTLAGVTVGMVEALLSGGTPEINDKTTYDNGVKVVPSFLLEPVSVDVSNWEEALIGSGYYTMDQIK